MENVTSRSEEHVICGVDQNSRGQNFAGQTSDPTTWVNNTPPKKNLSPLIGHVTIGGSPRVQAFDGEAWKRSPRTGKRVCA